MNIVTEIKETEIWPWAGVNRVPYRVYTDPQIYSQEQERLFRGPVWSFVGMESEIPNPRDYQTTYIGETPVVVLRDDNGDVRVMVNQCAHRGNLVCIKNSGNLEDGRLTCVYHNWTYDLDGGLRSVAFGKGINKKGGMPDDFDVSQHSLRRLRVDSYKGLIFATFSEDTPALLDFMGSEMKENVDRVVGRKMKLLGTYSQYMPNNWKLYMENVRDSYHASLLHLFQATFKINRLSMKGGIKLSDDGWHHISYSIAATDKEESQYNADDLRAVDDEYQLADPTLIAGWNEFDCGTTLAIQSIFPNFVVQQISNSIALRLCIPRGPEECELFWWVLGTEDDTAEQAEMRIKQSNMIGPGGLISMEDGVVGGWVQRATQNDKSELTLLEMGGRDVAPSEEGRATEVSIRGFWKGYRECMGI